MLTVLAYGFVMLLGWIAPNDLMPDFLDDLSNWEKIPIPFGEQIFSFLGKFLNLRFEIAASLRNNPNQILLDVIKTLITAFAVALLARPCGTLLGRIFGGIYKVIGWVFLNLFISFVCLVFLDWAHLSMEHYITSMGSFAVQWGLLVVLGLLWVFAKKRSGVNMVIRVFFRYLYPFLSQLLTWVGVVLIQQFMENEMHVEIVIVVIAWISVQLVADLLGIGYGLFYTRKYI
jgi:hypothetical protein